MIDQDRSDRAPSELSLSRLSINQATTRPQWNLRDAIEGYSKAGVRAISVWPEKLEQCGIDEARHLLRDHDMKVTSFCVGGMFGVGDSPSAARSLDTGRRLLDDAAAIGAQCMVTVVGTLEPTSKDLAGARLRIAEGLQALVPHARSVGVPLAIEPIHPMLAADLCCINTIAQANDLCDALGEGAGIALDVYHVWWDPALESEIKRSSGRILAFQICDWLTPTAMTREDRGMMGDGVIDIARIRRLVEDTGYTGPCDVEIMSSKDWWRRCPDEVVEICIERFQSVC